MTPSAAAAQAYLPGLEPADHSTLQHAPRAPRPGLAPRGPAGPPPLPRPRAGGLRVEVVRSSRRRKTVSARLVGDVVRLSIPATLSHAAEQRWVAEMLHRFERRASAGGIDLAGRARALAQRLRLPEPATVRWVDNQTSCWGSCTPEDRSVRISVSVAPLPPWVLDYVIVHELAHLAEAGHTPTFWELVNRYSRAERARGYLMAKSSDVDSP